MYLDTSDDEQLEGRKNKYNTSAEGTGTSTLTLSRLFPLNNSSRDMQPDEDDTVVNTNGGDQEGMIENVDAEEGEDVQQVDEVEGTYCTRCKSSSQTSSSAG